MDVRALSLRVILFSSTVCFMVGCDSAPPDFVNWETPHVHPIEMTPDGRLLLAVNTADNRLELFSITEAGPSAMGSVAVGLDPVSVRARSNTEAWVVNHVSDSVSVVNLETREVVATLNVGDEPCDVAFAGEARRAFVTLSQENRVRVYDPGDLTAAPITLAISGEDPRALAVSPDGSRVYAAIFESGNATTLVRYQDVSSKDGPYGGQNPPPNFGSDFFPALKPDAADAPKVGQIVRKVDGRWIDDNGADWSAKVTWDLFDHDVAIIDANTLDMEYASGLMTMDMNLAVHPEGGVTVIGSEALNDVRFEPNLRGDFSRVVMAEFDPDATESMLVHDLNPHIDYTADTANDSLRHQSISDPRDIVWSADGNRAYISGMGTDNVIVIDRNGNRIGEIDVPEGPTGLALDESRNRLYVMGRFDGSISTIDTQSNTLTSTVAFFDPTPVAVKIGRPLLYNARAFSEFGQQSCATCHVDARMDALAWDLGSPAGSLQAFDQPCNAGLVKFACKDWHPMKGPMTTQTLVGSIKGRPLHWRGDRANLAAFSGAYVSLLGMDVEPTEAEMTDFESFLATIKHPPNPNRLLDGSLRTAMTIRDQVANAARGKELYTTINSDSDLLKCVDCHELETGGNLFVVGAKDLKTPQQAVIAPLGSTYEKMGLDYGALKSSRGFGISHDGAFDHTDNFLTHRVFTIPTDQDRLDIEAFVLSFSAETHAAVGAQVTLPVPASKSEDSNVRVNLSREMNGRLSQLRWLADNRVIGLVARGHIAGASRGYAYVAGAGFFQADAEGETMGFDDLRRLASEDVVITWTAVPFGCETRIGIDRDADGLLDRDDPEPTVADQLNEQISALGK